MAKNLYLAEFTAWLPKNTKVQTEKSINDYKSHINTLPKHIFTDEQSQALWEVFPVILETDIELALHTLSVLETFFDGPSRYHSAFRYYAEFITSLNQDAEEIEEIEEIAEEEVLAEENISTPVVEETFDKRVKRDGKITISNFRTTIATRLKTQDRIYDPVYFPIRLLGTILKNGTPETKAYWKQWHKACTDSIKVYTRAQESNLTEIKSFMICTDGSVWVRFKDGKVSELLTRTIDGKELRSFSISKLDGITIEHMPTMKKLLSQQDNFPALKKVTEICKTMSTSKAGAILRKQVWEKASTQLTPLASEIQREMELLKQNMTLELMESSENRYTK